MRIVSHKRKWNWGTVQVHVEPPLIPLIKINNDEKLDKDFVKIELRGDINSEKSNLYKLKITLFDNSKYEEFLLFVRNLNMSLESSGMLKAGANIQYLSMLVRGEALRQFDT